MIIFRPTLPLIVTKRSFRTCWGDGRRGGGGQRSSGRFIAIAPFLGSVGRSVGRVGTDRQTDNGYRRRGEERAESKIKRAESVKFGTAMITSLSLVIGMVSALKLGMGKGKTERKGCNFEENTVDLKHLKIIGMQGDCGM